MPEITLTELRAKAKGRPESLTIALEDGTKVVLTHLLLLTNEARDRYLDALEAFMALSVDETANRAERRAADKKAGRPVGTTKAVKEKTAEELAEDFSAEDVSAFIGQIREGLVDVDKVHEAAGKVIGAAILDKKVAAKALQQLDTIDRATLINLHLGADQQGEA